MMSLNSVGFYGYWHMNAIGKRRPVLLSIKAAAGKLRPFPVNLPRSAY